MEVSVDQGRSGEVSYHYPPTCPSSATVWLAPGPRTRGTRSAANHRSVLLITDALDQSQVSITWSLLPGLSTTELAGTRRTRGRVFTTSRAARVTCRYHVRILWVDIMCRYTGHLARHVLPAARVLSLLRARHLRHPGVEIDITSATCHVSSPDDAAGERLHVARQRPPVRACPGDDGGGDTARVAALSTNQR